MTGNGNMSDSNDCGQDVAAYAVGALEPAEAEAFRLHLETCAKCRAELDAFTAVVDALPLSAPQYRAPRRLRRRVMNEVKADLDLIAAPQRRVRLPRPALAALCAAALAGAGLLGAELAAGPAGPATHVYAASVGNAAVRVSGDHAELIVRRLPQPGPGKIYEVWLKRGAKLQPAHALFGVDRAGRGTVVVPGSVHGVSAVLVTAEPAGGKQTPSSQPVVIAPLT